MKNIILFFLVVCISSCGKKPSGVYEQVVRSPIPENNIPFQEFQFDADSAVLITMETGSLVKFNASSFETQTGKPISGKITIKVREFHQAAQIFRAGIPMSTDETREHYLQTGGMIEVRAYHKDEELKLKAGRDGYIELAGFRPSDGYSLYQLGDDVRWRVKDSFQTAFNKRKSDRLKELELLSSESADTSELTGFEIAADLSEAPYLKPFKGITWEMAGGKNKTGLDLATAARMHWDSVKVYPVQKKQKLFRLAFIKVVYRNEKYESEVWSVYARPLLNGRSMDAILKEQEKVQKLIADEKQRLAKQADMVNAFRINQMGIWNIDKLMTLGSSVTASVSFDFSDKLDKDIQKVMVYMLFEDDNSVISMFLRDMKEVKLPRDRRVRFVAMLPGGNAVICDSDEVKAGIKSGSSVLKLKTRPASEKDFI